MNHNSLSFCSSTTSSSMMNGASGTNGLFAGRIKTSANTTPVQSTLPITCQICLSKVKEPCICPNLHVFCAMCIEIWLEKTKQCPTCRISINKENPCRRILGGIENSDDVDMLKPTEFSHPSTRKARYLSLFQQYEDEIGRLLQQIESMDAEIAKFKEASKNINPANISSNMSPNSAQYDMIQMLKTKLEQTQSSLEEAIKERNKLKEMNKKLESENSILLQDVSKLKVSLSEKSAQVSSRYTVAALESKLDSYEKEVKQLQKALEKSDKYIADLEGRLKIDGGHSQSMGSSMLTSTEPQTILQNANNSSIANQSSCFSVSNPKNHSTKASDSKTVKFADKIDTIPASHSPIKQSSTSSSSNRVILIPNERFYGSPSKTPTSAHKSAGSSISNVHISSFADRMKKNAMTSATEPQNLHDSESNRQTTQQPQTTPPSCAAQSFLFSPMKRLRLDEVYLEKPSEHSDAAKGETNENLSPASCKYRLSKRSPSDSEVMQRLGNRFASASFDKSNTGTATTATGYHQSPYVATTTHHASRVNTESDFITATRSVSPSSSKKKESSNFSNELDDCLQLLNEAEKKVMSSPPKSPLAGKYTSNSEHRLARSPSYREKSVAFDVSTYGSYNKNTNQSANAKTPPSPSTKPKEAAYSSLPDKYFMSSKIFENDPGASSDSSSTTTTTTSSGVSSSSMEMNTANNYSHLGDRGNYTTSSDHGPMFSYQSERRRSGSYSPSKSCSNMSTLVENNSNVNSTAVPKNPIYAKYSMNAGPAGMADHDYSQPSSHHIYRSQMAENDYRMNHN